MYLVVGLGNPGKEYENTYHNVGFLTVERIAKELGVSFDRGECRALTAHARVNGEKVILAKPITYMNLSGESVAELVHKYKIEADRFVVLYDDMDLPRGNLRIRYQGSAGTHNGMKNEIQRLGTQEFMRMRIGIGHPETPQMDVKDFVLSRISPAAMEQMSPAVDEAVAAVQDFVKGCKREDVMQRHNRKE